MRRRVLALVAGFAALLPFVLLPTTAAWTNNTHFTATASAGTWVVPELPAVSCRIPSAPTIPCTATIGTGSQWPNPITDFNRMITISTTSPTPVEWEVTFNVSSTTWPVAPARWWHDTTSGGLVLVSTSGCAAVPRTVTVKGTTAWGDHHRISSSKSLTFQISGSTSTGPGNLLSCP